MNNIKLLTLLTGFFFTFFSSYSLASELESISATEAEAVSEAEVSEASSSSSEISEATEVKETEVVESAKKEDLPQVADIEYTCRHDISVRAIRVFNDPPSGLACEVAYEKASGTKTLWTANFDKEFCARKAAEFAQKQVGWGWDCTDNKGVVVTLPVETPAPAPAEPEKPAAVDAAEISEEPEASEEAVETAPVTESSE